MNNTQKVAIVALIGVAVFVAIYVINTINSESARIQAEQEQAAQQHEDMCDNWLDSINDMKAEYYGRRDSPGGQFDLDGAVETLRNNLNLESDRYNLECVGEETNYFEEDLT